MVYFIVQFSGYIPSLREVRAETEAEELCLLAGPPCFLIAPGPPSRIVLPTGQSGEDIFSVKVSCALPSYAVRWAHVYIA